MTRVSEEVSKDILKNPPYGKILFYLSLKPNNSGELSNLINKPQSVIYRQLSKLEEEGYVKETKKYIGKKEYELNIENLSKYFLDHLDEFKKQQKLKKIYFFINHTIEEKSISSFKENFFKNQYLQKLIKFRFSLDYEEVSTIRDSFRKLFENFLSLDIHSRLEDISKILKNSSNFDLDRIKKEFLIIAKYSDNKKFKSFDVDYYYSFLQKNDPEFQDFIQFILFLKLNNNNYEESKFIEEQIINLAYEKNESNFNLEDFIKK